MNPTDWINKYSAGYSNSLRRQRIRRLSESLSKSGARGIAVLDVGGTLAYWEKWAGELPSGAVGRIDVVNLPVQVGKLAGTSRSICGVEVRFLAGNIIDGPCEGMAARYGLVHCSSVIEHVGDAGAQRAFAAAMRRLGDKLWVQTPAKEFPLEAHFRLPFFAWLPLKVRAFFNWRFRLGVMPRHRDWKEAVEFCRSTRLLTRGEFAGLFPDCRIWTEKFMLLPKCHVASDL